MSGGSNPTIGEYFTHHLGNWCIGSGFWSINLDTLIMSWVLMGSALYFFKKHQRDFEQLTTRPPSRLMILLEGLISFARASVRPLYLSENVFAGAAAFSIFIFVGMANFMGFIPPDLFPYCFSFLGIHSFKAQISSDVNLCLAMATVSVGLSIIRPVQLFGFKALIAQFAAHPFPHWIFFPINIPMNFLETAARLFSLTIRLFVNMMVGDAGFLLIAAFGPWWIQWLPWGVWTLMHCLVIPLQSYLFMLFSSVYLSMSLNIAEHAY